MYCMFSGCSSLKKLEICNFNDINSINMIKMFDGCSDELKDDIKEIYPNIKDEAFEYE